MVEQGTHKPLVGGSNPPSATIHPRDPALVTSVRIESFTSACVAIRPLCSSVLFDEGRTSVRGLLPEPGLYSRHVDGVRSSSPHPEAPS